jgi:homoserine O-acetyltransferase
MKINTNYITFNAPFQLESGYTLESVTLAYKTYGTLNKALDNAVFVCHALSGSAHLAFESDEESKKVGWWNDMVGPGKGIDTNKFFVICSNTLGSCLGSTGPHSINPKTNSPYGLSFPIITIKDMVNAQKKLCDQLGINQLKAVIGPSMGGMQALQWAISYPDYVEQCALIATASKLSPQAMAFSAVGRHSITADPNWKTGQYDKDTVPETGLGIARMIGHITYLSEESMNKKFGRKLQEKNDYNYSFDTEFQIESYLKHQGDKFVKQFDANSYLYLSKAVSYFDLDKSYGSLEKALENISADVLILSISSDWLYPTEQSKDIAHILMKQNKQISFCEIDSDYGHDSFLIEVQKFAAVIKPFLEKVRDQ